MSQLKKKMKLLKCFIRMGFFVAFFIHILFFLFLPFVSLSHSRSFLVDRCEQNAWLKSIVPNFLPRTPLAFEILTRSLLINLKNNIFLKTMKKKKENNDLKKIFLLRIYFFFKRGFKKCKKCMCK